MDVWVEEIENWETRPFSGGYAGLHELADSSFSGAVSTGETWALFVNGRVVTVTRRCESTTGTDFSTGDIEAFESADGTVHSAPHPGVPLLVAMRVADGETRGQYYTEDTPITEVDETLSEGGFTGYLELSENVLSGDYYTVYQAGRSMDIAFIGTSRRLQTDEEARESAHGEVGIYEVVAVDINVVTIPEPEDASDEPPASTSVVSSDPSDEPAADSGPSPDPNAPADEDPPTIDDMPSVTDEEPPRMDEIQPEDEASTPVNTAATEAAADTGDDSEMTTPMDPESTPSDGMNPTEPDAPETASSHPPSEPTDAARAPVDEEDESGSTTAASAATEQLASRSVPSVDPERSGGESGPTTSAGNRRDRPGSRRERDRSTATPATEDASARAPSDATDEAAELRDQLASVREELSEAEAARDAAREELADARATLEEVRDERDDLRAEVDRLRARLDELDTAAGGIAGGAGPSLSAADAVAGTDLFVRYESKGDTTVEDACEGRGSPEDLAANLRIDHHTRFETEGASVDGQPFGEWLHASQRYRFAEWVVSRLVFEIRETGSVDGLRALYETLPAIDRVELDGTVAVETDDTQVELGFDVVFRDRMGEPLFVADLDDSRDPVSDAEMADLVQDGLEVCRSVETFAAAFYVTAAFYEPAALETASDATSGSLLSRDSRLSFVKQSRKRGFHLALIEARDDEGFGLSVPEL